jgi:hypothetical protein
MATLVEKSGMPYCKEFRDLFSAAASIKPGALFKGLGIT